MSDHSILAPRQHQIAELVAEELTNKEIARQLGISLQTVKNTLIIVCFKLGVQSRVGIAVAVRTRSIVVRNMSGQNQCRAAYRHGGVG